MIDFYENRGEGLPHYAKMLAEKDYLYGTHNAPHDIEVRELGTGKSRREIAWDLGINFRSCRNFLSKMASMPRRCSSLVVGLTRKSASQVLRHLDNIIEHIMNGFGRLETALSTIGQATLRMPFAILRWALRKVEHMTDRLRSWLTQITTRWE